MRKYAWLRYLLALAVIAGMAGPATSMAAGFDASPMFQAGPSDPGTAAATTGLAEVARIVRATKGGAAVPRAAQGPALTVEELAPTPEPQVEELTPTPESAVVILVPTPTPETVEPVEEEMAETVEEAGPTPTDVEPIQYINAGVSLLAPNGWLVEPGEFGTIFNIEIPETEFVGVVQPLGIDEFPGLMAVVLFKTQPGIFVAAIDPGAQLTDVAFFFTGQQLPVAKISLSSEDGFGEAGSGAIYLVSPGLESYALYAFAAPDAWPEVEAATDLMAESLFFDPALIEVVTAEGGPLDYVDAESGLRLVLPEGWQITPTGDADMPAIIADPHFEGAGLLGVAPGTPEEEGLDAGALVQSLESGEGLAEAASMTQAILELMDFSSEEFAFDETLSEAFLVDGIAVLRIGGLAGFDEMLDIPMMLYVAMDEEQLALLILFGAEEQILIMEPEILEIMASVERIE